MTSNIHVLDIDPRPVILLVDDVPQELSFLSELLMDEYIVKVALNGEQGLKRALSDSPPDLILLDIMMEGIDGYEVCRQLKANPRSKNIPVIFLTSRQEMEDEQRSFELGAVDYITKPINPQILLARVQTHVALKRAVYRLRDLNRFISDSLGNLPDPTLVCDLEGKVLIANKAAGRHFNRSDLHGGDLATLMMDVRSVVDQKPVLQDVANLPSTWSLTCEGLDFQERRLLVRCVPSFAAFDEHNGWILSFTDLT